MPDLTPNYKFKKPIFAEETADIRVINENFDIADEELKKANDTIKNLGNDKQNRTDSNLLTIAKTIVGAINELFNNKLDKGGYTGTAQNLLTEISKIASKTVLGRMIVGKGLTVDSSGRTSVVAKNDGIIVNDNDIQLNTYSGLDSDSTSRPLAANQGKILDNKKADRYYIKASGSSSILYFKIGSMTASIGDGACGVSFILSGGNNVGQSRVQKISVTVSSRGYAGAGAIPDSLLSAVDITGDNSVSSCSFILKLNGDRLELWFKSQSYPYAVSIDAIGNTGTYFIFNTDMTWTATSPVSSSDTYKEYPIRKMYHTGNFDPATKFDKIGGTVTGDFNVSGATSFNKTVTFNGSALFRGSQIEIYNSTPYIDFHSGNSEGDYTTRLIDDGTSMHYLNAKTSKNIDFDKIVTTNDYSYIARRYDRIKDFDGTFGDFFSKHTIGVYRVESRTIMDKLNIPSGVYHYGTMLILPASSHVATLIYIADNSGAIWFWNGFNVINRPKVKFTEATYTWINMRDKATIGLSNVENVAQVTDVRFTGLTQKTTWNTAVNTYAAGRVICGIHKDSEGYNIDGVYYATMQKKVKGRWYTLAVE